MVYFSCTVLPLFGERHTVMKGDGDGRGLASCGLTKFGNGTIYLTVPSFDVPISGAIVGVLFEWHPKIETVRKTAGISK